MDDQIALRVRAVAAATGVAHDIVPCDPALGGGSRDCKVVGPPALLSALPNAEVVELLAVQL